MSAAACGLLFFNSSLRSAGSFRNGVRRLRKPAVRPGVLTSLGKQFAERFAVDADGRVLQSESVMSGGRKEMEV